MPIQSYQLRRRVKKEKLYELQFDNIDQTKCLWGTLNQILSRGEIKFLSFDRE